jgi:hypothetical protein
MREGRKRSNEEPKAEMVCDPGGCSGWFGYLDDPVRVGGARLLSARGEIGIKSGSASHHCGACPTLNQLLEALIAARRIACHTPRNDFRPRKLHSSFDGNPTITPKILPSES